MGILRLTHSFTSRMRLRVNFKSLSGVFGVFLINPCTATKVSECAQKNTRAMRLPAQAAAHFPQPLPHWPAQWHPYRPPPLHTHEVLSDDPALSARQPLEPILHRMAPLLDR